MNSDEHIKDLKDFIFAQLLAEGILKSDFKREKLDLLVFQSIHSLRLRLLGYTMLKNIYDHERFELKEKLTGRELMTLKKHVAWPYYLPVNHSHIVLFTIKESFLLKLQGGDVKKWLAQVHDKNSNKNK